MSTRSKARSTSKVIDEAVNVDALQPPIAQIDAEQSGDTTPIPQSESQLNQVQF